MSKHYYYNDLRVIAKLVGANMNITTDQALTIQLAESFDTVYTGEGDYIIEGIYVRNASVSLTTAAGGIYTAITKGGTALVAAGQVYSALTSSALFLALTKANTALTTVFNTATQPIIYFSLTTAQGAAATADIYVYGRLFQKV